MNKRTIKRLIVILIAILFINILNIYAININELPIGYTGPRINVSNLQVIIMYICLAIILIINNIKDKNTIRTVIISIITLVLSILSYTKIQAFNVSDIWYGTYVSRKNGLIIYGITVLILLINISIIFLKNKKSK